VAITTIPNLFGLNLISTITDFPTLAGDMDRVEKVGDVLMLAEAIPGDINTTEYYSDGYYYYEDLLDLGEIFTVRLQSLIQAEGFTLEDIMSEWVTLDLVEFMSNAKFSEWDVETQYRATDSFNVIADWASMSAVSQMNAGEDDDWSIWRKFASITDATGRIFQFRLRLVSNKTSVTPRVYDGTIKADMPDRIESYANLAAPNTGYILTYAPAFKGPGTTPAIQISIDGAATGDYWVFDYRNLTGFKVIFYDKNNVAVARNFDAQVRGFGRKASLVI
jgi:hypothetical protein